MGRLLIGALAIGLAAGLAIGLTNRSPGPALPRVMTAIARDARARYRKPVLRVRCEPFQRDPTRYSCTAVQYESALSFTGQVYVVELLDGGRSFRFRPYRIPIWLGI